ncbi:hypothetical protein TNCV_2441551 [Trichonephila clavipes]|nr:hypothetical protein TNCV_2441551 [Trichonephila clavipes]
MFSYFTGMGVTRTAAGCPIAIRYPMWFQHDASPLRLCAYLPERLTPRLRHDGLGGVDQSLGHPNLPIYRDSITFYGDI